MEQTINLIRQSLQGFELRLFDAAIANLQEDNNVLSANNFAYSIRELIRHILKRLAPDDDVKGAPWYEEEKNQYGEVVITRRQRIKYAVQKWFSDDYARENLKISLDDFLKDFGKNFSSLNNFTHIEEQTFNVEPVDKTMLAHGILGNLLWFIITINDARDQITNSTLELVDKELAEHFLADHIGALVLFFGKENKKRFCIEDITIRRMDDEIIKVSVKGTIFIVDPLCPDPLEYKERKPFVSEMDVNYKNKEGIVKIERGNINIDSQGVTEL
ncbi:hypothetical protein [Prevotella communis]|uniref:pPIWI-associating nuclease domain-containing protein n=1 Tax=Prevotella communis TaxID=2913614 RepID=UPI001EDB99B6|nr:hypothetical protein [Prevotella communis]UKK57921.1 hypothetical protein L6476_06710 [Prevotella communis]